MDGVLNILKPPGMTSHDVVAYLRRLTGVRKIGHTGTLDPGAAGVLCLCVGRATRLARFLEPDRKIYRAEITFGLATDTQDAFGEPVAEANAEDLTSAAITRVLTDFLGEQEQIPPMTSAVKQGGAKLYELARKGKDVPRKARPIMIYHLTMLRTSNLGSFRPRALVDVHCSKGTYVRTLCADIGGMLGYPAFMSFLVRVANGRFGLNTAITLEDAANEAAAGTLERRVIPPDEALSALPVVHVRKSTVHLVRNGSPLYPQGAHSWPTGSAGFFRLYDGPEFFGVAEWHSRTSMGYLRPVWLKAED